MRFQIKLRWKVVTRLASPEAGELLRTGLLFNQRGGRSFIRSIGGQIRTTYEPVVLEPTDVFHQALSKVRGTLGLRGHKFPYEMDSFAPGVSNRLNVAVRLYGQAVCLTFDLDSFVLEADTDLARLQKLESHLQLAQFVRAVTGIVASADRGAYPLPSLPKYYPVMQIASLDVDAALTNADLVALVTHHPLPRDEVVTAVLEKNQPHQVDRSTLLVDKQGIVSYVPGHAHATLRGNLQRFENASSMLELAAVLRVQLKSSVHLPEDVKRVISSAHDVIPESVSAQNTWNLIVDEFELKSELQNSSPVPMRPSKERVLVVAVTQVEVDALLSVFAADTGRSAEPFKVNGYIYQRLGQIRDFEVFLAISEMGSGGVAGSQESIRRAIEAIKPYAAFMVGIAFGIDKRKFSIGDILVSKQLLLYELQRVNSDSTFILRGDRAPASGTLLNWVRHATPTWAQFSKTKVEAGLILSGEKLIDNVDFQTQLATKVPDALGGEMEGSGLYVACEGSKVHWILMKAICDWADGNKGKNKLANQRLAAGNASAFLLHVLKSASPKAP